MNPTDEDKAAAKKMLAQLLRAGGKMDPDEAEELSDYVIEHAETG